MKHLTSRRPLVILIAVAAPLFSAVCAAQSPSFSVQVLANLEGGTNQVGVAGINDAGEAVGIAGGGTSVCPLGCVVIWRNGEPTPLGLVQGATGYESLSINNAGQVAGTALIAAQSAEQAVFWANGTPTLLPAPDTAHTQTFAGSLNDAGEIAGSGIEPGFEDSIPVVWNKLMPTILGFEAGYTSGGASAINNTGLVVGNSCCVDFSPEAVVWHGTVPALLPKISSSRGSGGEALAVNKSGIVVGHATNTSISGSQHAAAWADGVVTDLGALAGVRSHATALNNRGIIVGDSDTVGTGQVHATLWSKIGGATQDLNALISAGAAKQITLTGATGINDQCTIAANGFAKQTGKETAFLLTLNAPSTCVNGL